MTDEAGQPAPDKRYFPLTRLTLLQRARAAPAVDRRQALEEFARLYWSPLHCFLHRGGSAAEDAMDLVQGFFVWMLEGTALERFDPAKGRFRTWLLTCLKGFARDRAQYEQAAKRGGKSKRLPIGPDADGGGLPEPAAPDLSPEEAYERAWAVAKMRWAVAEVRRGLEAEGEARAIEVLDRYLQTDNPNRPGHEAIAQAAGTDSKTVRYLLEHLRKRLRATLLDQLREETGSADAARDELAWLLGTFERARGK